MCVAHTPAAVLVPALAKWSAFKPYGRSGPVAQYTLAVEGVGFFTISGVFANGVLLSGWKLTVAVKLPYGVNGKPYQLDEVADIKGAAKLVKAAVAFAGDKAARLRVMQAVLDAASVQHVE